MLVTILVKDGCSPKQAAAFERWLADTRPVGISDLILEHAIIKSMVHDLEQTQSLISTLKAENERLIVALGQYTAQDADLLFR